MKKLRKEKVPEFLEQLSNEYLIVAPVKNEKGYTEFKYIENFSGISLRNNSINSIKEFFFPQNEKLFTYKDGEINENIDKKKVIIFGARACDIESINVLDKVFLDERFIDKYYENRRENTIVIGYSCPKSESGCFCMSLGIDPVYSSLSELFMFEDEENFYFKLNDSKASKIVQGLEDADYKLIKNGHNQNFTIDIKFPLDQDKMFNAAFWDEIFRKCIGCGTCTYLCPTCHCFEFCEQKGEDGIERIRCWDSCQYSLFTEHASGHNPRNTQKQRVRQRVMHKFSYYPKNYDVVACVGCGRCVRKCPVTLDIREVLSTVEKYEIQSKEGEI